MGFDNAYEAINADNDPRWAFGTGFADPLAGVDPAVPAGVDGGDLAAYCLMLGDDALVMSHRLQQWCTNAPTLEDEVALANIALDLLGQARLLLTRAGQVDGSDRDEDAFAYFRDAGEFRNVRLVELDNGDFAECVVRLLLFATWRLALLARLVSSLDPVVAAIAAKGVKEVTYHRDYAAQWAVRLGDGTEHSRARMADAVAALWPYTAELFASERDRASPRRGRRRRRPRESARRVRRRARHRAAGGDAVVAHDGRVARRRRTRRQPHRRARRVARRAAMPRPRRPGGGVVSRAIRRGRSPPPSPIRSCRC